MTKAIANCLALAPFGVPPLPVGGNYRDSMAAEMLVCSLASHRTDSFWPHLFDHAQAASAGSQGS